MTEFYLQNQTIFVRMSDFDPARQTLVFIHGLSGSMSAWDQIVHAELAQYNRVLIDLRGHGKSHKYPQSQAYQIEAFADDLAHVLRCLELSDPILVSHSFGCLVALDYLLRYQVTAGRAVFLSARFNLRNRPLKLLLAAVLHAPRALFGWLPGSKNGQHLEYAKFPQNTDYNLRRMWADIANTGPYIYLSCLKHAARLDYRDRLHQIQIPVLFVHGEQDSIFALRHLQPLQNRFENAQLVTLPDANHVLIFSHPQVVRETLTAFIEAPA